MLPIPYPGIIVPIKTKEHLEKVKKLLVPKTKFNRATNLAFHHRSLDCHLIIVHAEYPTKGRRSFEYRTYTIPQHPTRHDYSEWVNAMLDTPYESLFRLIAPKIKLSTLMR